MNNVLELQALILVSNIDFNIFQSGNLIHIFKNIFGGPDGLGLYLIFSQIYTNNAF